MFSIETNRGVPTPSPLPSSVASKQARSNTTQVSALLRNNIPNTNSNNNEFTSVNNADSTLEQETHSHQDWDPNNPALEKTTKTLLQQIPSSSFFDMERPPPLTTVAVVKHSRTPTNQHTATATGLSRTKSLFSMGTSLSSSPPVSLNTNFAEVQQNRFSELSPMFSDPHQQHCIQNNDQDTHDANNNSVISMISIESTCTETTPANPVSNGIAIDSITHQTTLQQRSTHDGWEFALDMRRFLGDSPDVPNFDDYGGIRKVMEPHLRKARLAREHAMTSTAILAATRSKTNTASNSNNINKNSSSNHNSNNAYQSYHSQQNATLHATIATTVGVPYTALRQERPFLFDEHTHPLHNILAQTLGVPNLSQVHLHRDEHGDLMDPDKLLLPLLDRLRRRQFHEAYDSFVTAHCIPLLHSLAIAKSVFHQSSTSVNGVGNKANGAGNNMSGSGHVTYRYQAFPTIHVVRPGDDGSTSLPPTCDIIHGHSIGCLTFYIPLTPTYGTNCLFTESHPGRENWHPLQAKSVGLGYLFDGSRCLHFTLANTTDTTRVSLTFRVLIYRDNMEPPSTLPYKTLELCACTADDSDLCPASLLPDDFSRAGPGYYDEAVIDLQRRRRASTGNKDGIGALLDVVVKKHGKQLLDPDHRTGYPFV